VPYSLFCFQKIQGHFFMKNRLLKTEFYSSQLEPFRASSFFDRSQWRFPLSSFQLRRVNQSTSPISFFLVNQPFDRYARSASLRIAFDLFRSDFSYFAVCGDRAPDIAKARILVFAGKRFGVQLRNRKVCSRYVLFWKRILIVWFLYDTGILFFWNYHTFKRLNNNIGWF